MHFIKNNGKKLVTLALVPVIAINLYVGSRVLRGINYKNEKGVKSSTVQMTSKKDYNFISSCERELVEHSVEAPVSEEKSVFEKLQQIYLSSNKEVDELLENGDKKSEIYASALYVKLKKAGLSDEVIRREIDNILAYSLTFTDMDDETWMNLYGNMVGTISEYDNVIDYYYPLAIYVHKSECELEHSAHEFDESRLTCTTLEEINSHAFTEYSYVDYVISMIEASEDSNIINQYNRIVSSGVSFEVALDELNSIYSLSQVPMCIDEDVYNELFKHLLTTVGEYDNVFEIYGDLAYYVHKLGCDFEHYTDEYGVNVCEGMKLEYTYEN